MESVITVRMTEGEDPIITVSARADYYHFEQEKMVAATRTVDAVIEADRTERLREVLDDILADNADATRQAGLRGAAVAGAVSARNVDD